MTWVRWWKGDPSPGYDAMKGGGDHGSQRVGPPPINLGVRGFGELTISMAACEGLALVTLAKIEK